jgi:CheY-like chemotaxis protein
MSEAMTMPPLADGASAKRMPTVYFIDDSATMREVIKIAFRRENINVVTCPDAASALSQFDQNPPDAVITDVIMPDQDGFSVCTQIKEHPQYGATPVILMSGVVNKTVADRAVEVKADELVRKPFQPQELIGRVKHLLGPKVAPESKSESSAANALNALFAPPVAPPPPAPKPVPTPVESLLRPEPLTPAEHSFVAAAWPRALAEAFLPNPLQSAVPQPPERPVLTPTQPTRSVSNADIQKLRGEIARLELLVKKLQTELQIERQYNQALELHIRNLNNLE